MFGSYLVELVVGLCFLFAVLGIVTSAVTEAALTIMKVRSSHLNEWLVQWVEQLQAGALPAQVAAPRRRQLVLALALALAQPLPARA